jgi:hypothetical protein
LSVPERMLSHMAKKQTRRCVSLSRLNYEAAKQEAVRRGMTITALVEFALNAIGVPVVAHPQQSPDLAREIAARRAESVMTRRDRKVAATQSASQGHSRF